MRYSINIENAKEESGKILFGRLIHLISSVSKISEGALQIKLMGASKKRGKRSTNISKALEIKLTGIKNESTALLVECDKFKDSITNYQFDLLQNDFFEHTPISILMSCYRTVLGIADEPEVFIDKPLINEMRSLSEAFTNNEERIVFMNEGTVDDLVLTKKEVSNIVHIKEKIPPDQKLIIFGMVEELKYSKQRVGIKTEEGLIQAYLSRSIEDQTIAEYWGKTVSVAGIMHYGLKGAKIFEITRIFEDSNEIDFFKTLPKQNKLFEAPPPNRLAEWEGKWSDDEPLEELLKDI